jgi:uncharacterized protein (DUF58 family)
MWRFAYWAYHSISGVFFWFRRRFSPAGKVAVGTTIVAGALGIDTTQTLAYQIFTVAGAALLLALGAAYLMRPRFAVRREAPRVVTAGQEFSYKVAVRNLGRRRADGLLLIEQSADARPSFAQFRGGLKYPTYRGWWELLLKSQAARVEIAAIASLAPGEEAMAEVRGQARRRGTFVLHAAAVAQADPLGLALAMARVPLPDKLTVLPRRYALPPMQLPGSRRYQHGGLALSASVGNSEEFASLREYRPGDPLQHIHWKSFARLGEPVVREYQDEFFERHALVLDTYAGAGQAEAFEEAISVAASYACTVDTQECLLDLLFVGTELHCYTAGRGQLQSGQLVEILAGIRNCTDQPFEKLADSVLGRRPSLSGCILILLGCDPQRQNLVQRLRAGGVPLLVLLIASADEEAAPPDWHVLLPGKIAQGLAAL